MEVVAFLRRPSADSLARHSLWFANAGEESGLHSSSRCHAGPRHRRKYRDIQLGECSDAGVDSSAASGAVGGAALVGARVADGYWLERFWRLQRARKTNRDLQQLLVFLSHVQSDSRREGALLECVSVCRPGTAGP